MANEQVAYSVHSKEYFFCIERYQIVVGISITNILLLEHKRTTEVSLPSDILISQSTLFLLGKKLSLVIVKLLFKVPRAL